MAIKIKSATEIAQKYSRVTPLRMEDFESGIQATSPDEYEDPTIAAEPIYERGVQQAIARKAFSKGVEGSGAKWKAKRFFTVYLYDYDGEASDEDDEVTAIRWISIPDLMKEIEDDPANFTDGFVFMVKRNVEKFVASK